MIQPSVIDTAPANRQAAKAVIREAMRIGASGTAGDHTVSGLLYELLKALDFKAPSECLGALEFGVEVDDGSGGRVVVSISSGPVARGRAELALTTADPGCSPKLVQSHTIRTPWEEVR